MNIRCAGRVHDCPRASWGTPSGCCRSLRHEIGHIEAPEYSASNMLTENPVMLEDDTAMADKSGALV